MTPTPTPSPVRKELRAGNASLFARSANVVGAVALAAELLMVVVPATAASHDPSRVHIGDLDLNSDVDAAVLEQRIATAARTICRAPDRISDPLIGYRRCIADTTASARLQLDEAIQRSRTHVVPTTRTEARENLRP
jgi:UrcA family protein